MVTQTSSPHSLVECVLIHMNVPKNCHTVVFPFSLLSAAIAAATEGGNCLRSSFSSVFATAEAKGTTANRDSMSLSVRTG